MRFVSMMSGVMLMQGKTLLFKRRCESACFLRYREAMKIDASRARVASGTVFCSHKPCLLRE